MALFRVSRSLLSQSAVRSSLGATSTRTYTASAASAPQVTLDEAAIDRLYSLDISDEEIDRIIDGVSYQCVDLFSFEEGRKAVTEMMAADPHPAAQRTHKRLLDVKTPADMEQALKDFVGTEGTAYDPDDHHGPQAPGDSIFWPTGHESRKSSAVFVTALAVVPAVLTWAAVKWGKIMAAED